MADASLAAIAHPARTDMKTPEPVRTRQPLASRRYALEIRQHMAWRWQALVLAIALLVGLAISAAILVAAGVPADELANEFVMQTFFDGQNFRACCSRPPP